MPISPFNWYWNQHDETKVEKVEKDVADVADVAGVVSRLTEFTKTCEPRGVWEIPDSHSSKEDQVESVPISLICLELR